MRSNYYSYLLAPAFALFALSVSKNAGAGIIKPADTAATKSVTLAFNSPTFKVVGYVTSWGGNVDSVQYTKLTHINYAFLKPLNNGDLAPLGRSENKLKSVTVLAHKNNVKVLISVGGGGGGDAFHKIVPDSAYRTNFVNNMVKFVDQYNIDGVDIDWEFPSEGVEANNFLLMMQQLATAMHAKGKLCTIASISNDAKYVVAGLFPVLDFINIMHYDDNSYLHSTYESAIACLAYWKQRGLPTEKTVLGVPFYARDKRYDYKTANYNDLLKQGANPNLDTITNYGFNGLITMKKKADLALNQTGGILIWELGGDVNGKNSLLSAIDNEVLAYKAPIGKSIALKGFNNKYVSSGSAKKGMTCTSGKAGSTGLFTVVDAGGGKVALLNKGKYVSSENGLKTVSCTTTTMGDNEKFDWMPTTDGRIALRGNNGKFISIGNGKTPITCTSNATTGAEAFSVNQ